MRHALKGMATIITAAALMIAIGGPIAVSAQTAAAPLWGVPGSTFTFMGDGFRAATSNDRADPGEKLTFWINTPDGRVIDTIRLSEKDKEGRLELPFIGTARHDGSFILTWKAPADSIIGDYTLVAHGLSSQRELVIPFVIKPQSAAQSVQYTVTPQVGKAGEAFYFAATGFAGGDTKREPGERIAYWINTPDGQVISTVAEKDDDELAPRPLVDRARHDGTVRLVWIPPVDALAGDYTLVMHGLDTQFEVILPFTVR